MIFSFEEKVLSFLKERILLCGFVLVIIISLLIRYELRNVVSADAKGSLLPWYSAMKANGGFTGLAKPIKDCNYSFAYQFLIALMTYIPIHPLHAYKIVSIIFDYLLAFAVGACVYKISLGDRLFKAFVASSITICSPIVFMNSAAWAQCDSIYTFWTMLAIVFLLDEKYALSFISYGLAFSFKFQAVFALPFFLFYYFYKKRFSILYFLIIPICMVVTSIPALVMGRHISEVFSIYFGNVNLFQSLSMGYPTFWRIIVDGTHTDGYAVLEKPAILFSILLLGCFITYWTYKKIELDKRNIIFTSFLLIYTSVYFLPALHERYGFLYEILAIVVAFAYRKTIPLMMAIALMTMMSYGVYLFGNTISELSVSLFNFIIYSGYVIILKKEILKGDTRSVQ